MLGIEVRWCCVLSISHPTILQGESWSPRLHCEFMFHMLHLYVSKYLRIYQPPDGFLQSEFVAPIAQQFLRYAKNLVLDPVLDAKNPPKSLYALILIAVGNSFFSLVACADEYLCRWSGPLLCTYKAHTYNLLHSCMKHTGNHFKSSTITLILWVNGTGNLHWSLWVVAATTSQMKILLLIKWW